MTGNTLMTTLATVVFLAFAAISTAIGMVIMLVRAVRRVRDRRRARRGRQPRRVLLAVAAGDEDPEAKAELVRLPAGDWRAVERTAFELLTKVRGEARAGLAEVFIRRGLVTRAHRNLRRRGAIRRARAAGALGSLGYREAVPDLCRLLADPHDDVRVAAIHALGRIGDPAAAGPLLASLRSHHPAPSQPVAHSLIQLGQPAVPELVAALDDRSALVRATALDALRLLGASTAEERVAAVLRDDPSLEVRLRAAATLGRIGARAALPRLLPACGPEQPTRLRAAAARALGELGTPAAVAPLRGLLASPHYRVGKEAARALVRLGAEGAGALASAATGIDRAAAHAREALALAQLSRHQSAAAPPGPAQASLGG